MQGPAAVGDGVSEGLGQVVPHFVGPTLVKCDTKTYCTVCGPKRQGYRFANEKFLPHKLAHTFVAVLV